MRRLFLALPLCLAVAACRGTQPYTQKDLQQTKQAYATIPPIYMAFKRVYLANDKAGIVREYHREQQACKLVDKIDKRDTIDPNVNLFAVSAGLDSLCNDIESAYTDWAIRNGYPYDQSIPAAGSEDEFVDGDANLVKMPKELAHPRQLS